MTRTTSTCGRPSRRNHPCGATTPPIRAASSDAASARTSTRPARCTPTISRRLSASPRTGEQPATTPPRREPGRITIGTDPSGVPRRPPPGTSRRRSAQQRSGRPAGPARTAAGAAGSGRNLPAAVIAGVVLAALFVVATLWRPAAVLALVTVILAIAAFEYFGKVTEKGYRPAVAPGLAACVAAPLAAYWAGNIALPLVVAFAFIAASVGFLGASGRRIRPASQHGRHHDGSGVDRAARFVRRPDPRVVEPARGSTTSEPTRCS